MNENVDKYISLSKEIRQLQSKIKELKGELKELEPAIRDYIVSIEANSVSYRGTTIVLYSKVIKKKPNKDEVKERLETQVGCQRAEELIKTIQEPIEEFTEEKLKVVTKK